MIAFIDEPNPEPKKPFMTLADMRVIAKAWRPPKPQDAHEIIEDLEASDPDSKVIHYPGLEAALIGTVERCGQPMLMCYSRARIAAILMQRDGMSEENAEEYIDANIAGGWMGEFTPVLLS